jgi:hypothetical protein
MTPAGPLQLTSTRYAQRHPSPLPGTDLEEKHCQESTDATRNDAPAAAVRRAKSVSSTTQ